MDNSTDQAFACHGGEKMIYDVRMGPQAVVHGDMLVVVYPAGEAGPAHPHLITCDVGSSRWSESVRIGTVPRYDHHFNPIIWFDQTDRAHVLYCCHGADGGVHVLSSKRDAFTKWSEATEIAPSISYPRLVHLAGGELLLYYRALGHMGYWAYKLSQDGGNSWGPAATVVDMDRDPQTNNDTWAGSYHSVAPSRDGRFVHVAFVYLDEQKRRNPLYNRRFMTKTTINRYHLYYFRLNPATGELADVEGTTLAPPLNRAEADRCKVWDSGFHLTNMPSILVNERDEPSFLFPVSGDSPWQCTFYFVSREKGEWREVALAVTNNPWCAGLLRRRRDGKLSALLVLGTHYGELTDYGGGEIEEWTSSDDGATWSAAGRIVPEQGLLYNNPREIERSNGTVVPDAFIYFGWNGIESLHQAAKRNPPAQNTGKAFFHWESGR